MERNPPFAKDTLAEVRFVKRLDQFVLTSVEVYRILDKLITGTDTKMFSGKYDFLSASVNYLFKPDSSERSFVIGAAQNGITIGTLDKPQFDENDRRKVLNGINLSSSLIAQMKMKVKFSWNTPETDNILLICQKAMDELYSLCNDDDEFTALVRYGQGLPAVELKRIGSLLLIGFIHSTKDVVTSQNAVNAALLLQGVSGDLKTACQIIRGNHIIKNVQQCSNVKTREYISELIRYTRDKVDIQALVDSTGNANFFGERGFTIRIPLSSQSFGDVWTFTDKPKK